MRRLVYGERVMRRLVYGERVIRRLVYGERVIRRLVYGERVMSNPSMFVFTVNAEAELASLKLNSDKHICCHTEVSFVLFDHNVRAL